MNVLESPSMVVTTSGVAQEIEAPMQIDPRQGRETPDEGRDHLVMTNENLVQENAGLRKELEALRPRAALADAFVQDVIDVTLPSAEQERVTRFVLQWHALTVAGQERPDALTLTPDALDTPETSRPTSSRDDGSV